MTVTLIWDPVQDTADPTAETPRMPPPRMVAHPIDSGAPNIHVVGALFLPHVHTVHEDWHQDLKQEAGAHIDRWHFRVPVR